MAIFDEKTGERIDVATKEPTQQAPKPVEQTPAQPEPQRHDKRRNR